MRFIFDTSVLIDYLRDESDIAVDALFIAAERGRAFVCLFSLMELCPPQGKSDPEVQKEIEAIQQLCKRLDIRIIPSSQRSQEKALSILRQYRSLLGRNGLPDSLILGVGVTRRAHLVTRDKKWFRIDRKDIRVISPEELVERLG